MWIWGSPVQFGASVPSFLHIKSLNLLFFSRPWSGSLSCFSVLAGILQNVLQNTARARRLVPDMRRTHFLTKNNIPPRISPPAHDRSFRDEPRSFSKATRRGLRQRWKTMRKIVGNDRLAGAPNWPLMMCETLAAAYVGPPLRDFNRCVKTGAIPAPNTLGSRSLWNRRHIDRHLDAIMDPATLQADHLTEALEKWSRS